MAKYDRTIQEAPPQQLPGDIDEHNIVSLVAPGGNASAYLVRADVNLHGLVGDCEVWLGVGNVYRAHAIVTGNGYEYVPFGGEVVKGGQTVFVTLRCTVPVEIGPDTILVLTAL